jgi:predicted DNA-binding transcriptional regulator AlpA
MAKKQLRNRAAEVLAATDGSDDDLLNTRELAAWLQVSAIWCEIGRSKGYGPPFIRLSPTCVRYRRGAVRAWLQQRSHTSTSEYRREVAGSGNNTALGLRTAPK